MHQKRRLRMETKQKRACAHKHNHCSIKIWPKHTQKCNIAAVHKSCASLQVCAGGFKVCKTKQIYVTLSHTLVFNHAPKKHTIYDKKKT